MTYIKQLVYLKKYFFLIITKDIIKHGFGRYDISLTAMTLLEIQPKY